MFSLPLGSSQRGINWQLQRPRWAQALLRFYTGGSNVTHHQTLYPSRETLDKLSFYPPNPRVRIPLACPAVLSVSNYRLSKVASVKPMG